MVHTRQSAGFALQAAQLETPKVIRADGLEKYFEQFTQQEGITLPYQERSSPSKRRKSPGHDVVQKFSYLYFKDKRENTSTLSRALVDFRLRSPTLHNNDDKLNHLLDALSIVVSSIKKNGQTRSPDRRGEATLSPERNGQHHDHGTSMDPPKSVSKSKDTPTSTHWPPLSTPLQRDDIDPPPSPTFSIKTVIKMPLDKIAQYPELPAPRMEPQKSFAGITSLNTSFTTTTSANTSFWSEAPGSQEPASPASSIGSIPCLDGANNLQDITNNASQIPMSSCSITEFDARVNEAQKAFPTTGPQVSDNEAKCFAQNPGKDSELAVEPRNRDLESRKHANGLPTPETAVDASSSVPGAKESVLQAGEVVSPDTPRKKSTQDRILKIPADGIAGGLELSPALSKLPFELRFECARVMQACELTSTKLEALWQHPRTFDSLREVARRFESKFQSKSKAAYDNSSLHVNFRWTDSKDKDKSVFVPELLSPRDEHMNSWQRKFGWDRFLFVDTDSLSKPPKGEFRKQKDAIHRQVLEMLGKPQEFLGRTWLQFYVQQKKSKRGDISGAKQPGAYNFIFFALSGDNGNLPPLGLRDIIGWAIPFSENKDEPLCKSYARFDLRASRTVQVLDLNPGEIEFVDDDRATRDLPDTRFNNEEHAIEFEHNEIYYRKTVMNDGCSEVPYWTLRQIGLAFGQSRTPSAAQFRCAGAKGMIFSSRIDDDEDAENPYAMPSGPKLRISKSQLKLKPPNGAQANNGYDRDYYSLQVIAISHPSGPSYLYTDFLPILVACGVSPTAIENLAVRHADHFKETLMSAIESREAFRKWLHEQHTTLEERRRNDDIATRAGFPQAGMEKAIQMLESGFEPTAFTPLADIIAAELQSLVKQMLKAIKIVLPLSTMVYGIADPSGTLEPGEIHLCFSTSFHDRTSDRSWTSLHSHVLVARTPSARASDIQKVRAVYKPELAHLQDVVVFSKKGPRPLAGKLSGGDYDGDMFWICWEPLLVKPFENRPAPQQLPDPTSLGIKVDKRKLGDIVSDPDSEDQTRHFVRIGTANRMNSNWLGVITIMHARVMYVEGLLSPRAVTLTNAKDLLIDSDKNGYTFDSEALERFKQENDLARLPTPAYFKYKRPADEDDEVSVEYEAPKHANIVDRIYFWTLKPRFDEACEAAVKKLQANASDFDADLTAFYNGTALDALPGSVIKYELVKLDRNLGDLKDRWKKLMDQRRALKEMKAEKKGNELFESAVVECRETYLAIKPETDQSDPTIKEWMRRGGHALTIWERLKASALMKQCWGINKGSSKVWLHITGSEICQMKADASLQSRTLVKSAYMGLGPRKRKREPSTLDDELDPDEAQVEGVEAQDAARGAES